MDPTGFWKLISSIDADALEEGDEESAVESLVAKLAKLDDGDLQTFDEQLARVLYDLDTRAHADAAGDSGKSADGFLYARCFVVASGQKTYERVLGNPREMPKNDEWCEALLGVAAQAWAQRTGNDEADWTFDASVSYETGSNAAKWR